MSRKDDLEQSIRESYEIIDEYQAVIRTSDRSEEKVRARRIIREQRALIKGYQAEIDALTGDTESSETDQRESPYGRKEWCLAASQLPQPEMILIPASGFSMGSNPQRDRQAEEREQPQHSLYLPDYYVSRTLVTNAWG